MEKRRQYDWLQMHFIETNNYKYCYNIHFDSTENVFETQPLFKQMAIK